MLGVHHDNTDCRVLRCVISVPGLCNNLADCEYKMLVLSVNVFIKITCFNFFTAITVTM